MTQALADAFATGIAEHPEDWHGAASWSGYLDPGENPVSMDSDSGNPDNKDPDNARQDSEKRTPARICIVCPYSWTRRAASSSTSVTWPNTSSAADTRSPRSPPRNADTAAAVRRLGGPRGPGADNGSVARLSFGFRQAGCAPAARRHLRRDPHPRAGLALARPARALGRAGPHRRHLPHLQPALPGHGRRVLILQAALEKISARIAVSEYARRTLVEHLGGDAVVIPNGVDVDFFARAKPKSEWQGGTLGFIGRIDEPRKGLPVLTKALPKILAERPGTRLLVAGMTRRRPSSPCPPRCARASNSSGMVSDEDKARLLRSVDVYVAPNTGGESFGIILVEAMSAGASGAGLRPRRVRPGPRPGRGRRTLRQRGRGRPGRRGPSPARRPRAPASRARGSAHVRRASTGRPVGADIRLLTRR